MKTSKILLIVTIFIVPCYLLAEDHVRITTWNIEHLGSTGRGFGGGYGSGNLPLRSDEELSKIAFFLKETINSQIYALQEIHITHEENGKSRSKELDKIVNLIGSNWKYYLPPKKKDHNDFSMYVGYLWNENYINAIKIAPLNVPEITLANAKLFDRIPIMGYFEILDNQETKNDFLLINLHLASDPDNDENHIIAMTLIEYQLKGFLKLMEVTESDRIILGDFNDNPYIIKTNGLKKYSDALYRHMEFKGYNDFVTGDFHSTRMDDNLTSIIDHILINTNAQKHVLQDGKANIWLPIEGPDIYPEWRRVFSDHFPISFDIRISDDDDADWND